MIASAWSSAVDAAIGVLVLVVLALVRAVLLLRDRVARLEGRLERRNSS